MDNLTDILNYIEDNKHLFVKGFRKNKSRVYVDKRNYLIFILTTQYNVLPKTISEIFNCDRTLYYNSIKAIPYLLKDNTFINNIKTELELFPYAQENVEDCYLKLKKIGDKKNSNDKDFLPINCGLTKSELLKLKENPSFIPIIRQLLKLK